MALCGPPASSLNFSCSTFPALLFSPSPSTKLPLPTSGCLDLSFAQGPRRTNGPDKSGIVILLAGSSRRRMKDADNWVSLPCHTHTKKLLALLFHACTESHPTPTKKTTIQKTTFPS